MKYSCRKNAFHPHVTPINEGKNVAYLTYYVGRYCKVILRAFTKIMIISELKSSNEISLCPILKLASSSVIKVLFQLLIGDSFFFFK